MRKLSVYNNLIRAKHEFRPIKDDEVTFYSCGPTTYDFVHVGNARAFVIGDMIFRALKVLGYNVKFVRNFTDVDDKIINRAKELGVNALEHSAKYVEECKQDMASLGMLEPDHTPLVSETIDEIIEMIKTLEEKGYAYHVEGEVLYHVPKFKGYGKLSKKDLDSLQHGVRVEVDKRKKHPSDFSLWKPAKEGEISWDSPWGKGRPGWHIECSAMAKKFLGETIDFHHGGVDLMFPHHENEIAQSEACNGKDFVNYWCHHEFLNFGSEKMSKSLGNVVTIRNFVETYSGEILRQLLASVHYRSVMYWTDEVIERGVSDIERIHKFIINFNHAKVNNSGGEEGGKVAKDLQDVLPKMMDELANDFNTPGTMSHFFSMIRLLNREFLDENQDYSKKKKLSQDIISCVAEVIQFIKDATGLVHDDAEGVLERVNKTRKKMSKSETTLTEQDIEQMIKDRKEARTTKNWGKADEIRDKFNEAGIVLKDNPDGSVTWSYK